MHSSMPMTFEQIQRELRRIKATPSILSISKAAGIHRDTAYRIIRGHVASDRVLQALERVLRHYVETYRV
jgi:hypothetical protein